MGGEPEGVGLVDVAGMGSDGGGAYHCCSRVVDLGV